MPRPWPWLLCVLVACSALPCPSARARALRPAIALRGGHSLRDDPFVELMRSTLASARDAFRDAPEPVRALVGLNALVFMLWRLLPQRVMFEHFTLSLENTARGRWWTLLTSPLSHVGLVHLAWNMAATLAFGPAVVAALGAPLFVALVFAAALTSALADHLYKLALRARGARGGARSAPSVEAFAARRPSLGFSGVVMALVVVHAFVLQRHGGGSLTFLGFGGALEPLQVLGLGFLVELAVLALVPASPISHANHLGGALAGWLAQAAVCAPAGLAARCAWRRASQPSGARGLVGGRVQRRALCGRHRRRPAPRRRRAPGL